MSDLKHGIKLKLTEENRFGLAEIIAAIGEEQLAALTWKVQMDFLVVHYQNEFAQDATFVAPVGDGWIDCSTAKKKWSFERLMRLSCEGHQVVDGEFVGFKSTPKGKRKWVVLKAFDSSWWEVWSPDAKILTKVRDAFQNSEEIVPE